MRTRRAVLAGALASLAAPAIVPPARAAKDFEIPGAKDIAFLAAQEKQAIADNW
jgi:hypothetical protein